MQYYKRLVFFSIFLAAGFSLSKEGKEVLSNKTTDFSGKQSAEWEKIQSDLATVKGKLESQSGVVKGLIIKKNLLKGEELDSILDELKKEYERIETLTEEYNRINLEYLTKFPERGTKGLRIYKRIKAKSLQAYENELTVQGRVNRLRSKLLSQYPKTNKEPKNKKVIIHKADEDKNENSKNPELIDVTEPILIKK